MNRRQIFNYIISLCFTSWLVQLAILNFAGAPDSDDATPYMIGVMFLPGIFGLFYTLRYQAVRQSILWLPKNFMPFLMAILVPLLVAFVLLAIFYGFGFGTSDYFSVQANEATIASGPWLLGIGGQAWPHFIVNIILTTALYGVITGLVTIGEEYGWRAVLQNSLIKEFGFTRGVGLLGIVWALWHAPIIIAGYNYPDTPILGAFVLLPALLIGASYIMAWLTLWNRSFWPAVLMHGVINSTYDPIITRVTLTNSGSFSSLAVPLIEIGLFMVCSLLVIRFMRKKTR